MSNHRPSAFTLKMSYKTVNEKIYIDIKKNKALGVSHSGATLNFKQKGEKSILERVRTQ